MICWQASGVRGSVGYREIMGVTGTLFASLFWGSVGLGFAVYGKKQGSVFPLVGGILLMGISYVIGSALYMSLVSIAIVAAIIYLSKRFG